MTNPNHTRLGPIEHALALSGVLRDVPRSVGDVSLAELWAKLDAGDDVVLVMAMDRRRFERAHIDRSVDLATFLAMAPGLAPDTEIVVYCTDPACAASILGASTIAKAGFSNVRRYAGGLSQWAEAGLPLVTSELQAA